MRDNRCLGITGLVIYCIGLLVCIGGCALKIGGIIQ